MDFKQEKTSIKGTPSAILSNLTSLDGQGSVYAHGADIIVVGGSGPLPTPAEMRAPVTSLKWCNFATPLLCATTTAGVQVWNLKTNSIVLAHALDSGAAATGSLLPHACGVAADTAAQELHVGTSTGAIMTWKVSGEVLTYDRTFTVHEDKSAVVALALVGPGKLASGSHTGKLVVADVVARTILHTWAYDDDAVTAVVSASGPLAVAFLNGYIRLYDPAAGVIRVEICAHSRSVTALAMDPSAGKLVSVSEDSSVNVWRLNEGKVALAFSQSFSDVMLFGVALVNGHKNVQISAYDTDAIFELRER